MNEDKAFRNVDIYFQWDDNKVYEHANIQGKNSLQDEMVAFLKEFMAGYYADDIHSACTSLKIQPMGVFDLDDIEEQIYEYALSCLSEQFQFSIVSSRMMPADESTVLFEGEVFLLDILETIIQERRACEQSSIDVGECVETSLVEFVGKSSWHCGWINPNDWENYIEETKSIFLNYAGHVPEVRETDERSMHPLVWFGLPDQAPIRQWSILNKQEDYNSTVWFFDDQYVQLDKLIKGIGCNDIFLIWYFAECGRYFPEIDDIIETCPIDLNNLKSSFLN